MAPLLDRESLDGWKAVIASKGFPARWTQSYQAYMEKLNYNGFPIIFEGEHLALLMNVVPAVLSRAVYNPKYFYRSFEVPKRTGGVRSISAPLPSLFLMQKWLASEIFSRAHVHAAANAYVSSRSHISHAELHIGSLSCLKIDLVDFFGSIKFERLMQMLNAFGYLPNVSFQIASLCCLNGSIPQGASSSPILSNILLYSLDSRLTEVASCYNLKYSRYSDDMCFSGEYVSQTFSTVVKDIIEQEGFAVNENKSVLMSKGGRRIITGIAINSGTCKPPRAFRRDLRQDVHRIRTLGIIAASTINGCFDPKYVDRVLGRLNYWLQVEPGHSFAMQARESIAEKIAAAS